MESLFYVKNMCYNDCKLLTGRSGENIVEEYHAVTGRKD